MGFRQSQLRSAEQGDLPFSAPAGARCALRHYNENGTLDTLGEKVEKSSEETKDLGDMFREEFEAQSIFRGTYVVNAGRKDYREVARLFACRHGLRRIKARQVSD